MPDILCVGHAAFDVTMQTEHHPAADEKMLATALNLAGGGPAANAAVQVARLGGSAGFCGYLGRDVFGHAHLAELEAAGVDTRFVVRGEMPTPVSQILAKPDGSRSVVNYRGDTIAQQDAALLPSSFENKPSKLMLFDGHEPALALALCAQAADTPTILDAGSLHAGTKALAEKVDVLAASQKFASQWCETEDMNKALEVLAGVNDCVVVTMGKQGLIWARNGQRGSLPGFAVEALDSTGAGDSFHGALALALAQDMEWTQALRFASAAGALTCTRLGARAALPVEAEVEHLLRTNQ